jgi:hypothetical protein
MQARPARTPSFHPNPTADYTGVVLTAPPPPPPCEPSFYATVGGQIVTGIIGVTCVVAAAFLLAWASEQWERTRRTW